MALTTPGLISLHGLRAGHADISPEVFYLSAASNFRVRFGVFLGERIGPCDSLNPGDIYQISYDANWVEVFRTPGERSIFSLPLPTRSDPCTLEPLAYLIFMSERGQTFDVWPVQFSGIDHIITNAPFRFCEEYTLIEIHDGPSQCTTRPDRSDPRGHSFP